MSESRSGILSAIGAFVLWGILPLFWKTLDFLPPVAIIAHRTLWALLFLLPVILATRRTSRLVAALSTPSGVGWQLLSGTLLAANWTLYVWATLNDRILEGALGYYLNPFLNMLFGALFFGERQNRFQTAAIVLAAAGAALQFPAVDGVPWVALVLATTFALYTLVRKRAPLGSLDGLAAETLLLAPLALGWLLWTSPDVPDAFGGTWPRAGLVIASGLVTAAPLLLFGHAARSIRLTTLGILQFIAPTLQFLVGWKVYGEPLGAARIASFGLIWLAIALYAADALRRSHRAAATKKDGPLPDRPPEIG